MESIIDIKDLNGREVAVGEKVRINGEVCECVECENCDGCYFESTSDCVDMPFECGYDNRNDRKSVIFVKQEQMETNENKALNIAEILKDCPVGTELYSPMFGEAEFMAIEKGGLIKLRKRETGTHFSAFYLNPDGSYYENGECMLFPSKDQRDWSKFKLPVKPPFDIKRAEIGEPYYTISYEYTAIKEIEEGVYADNERYKGGHYFNTPEQAEYAAGKVKELLLSLRKEDK